MAVGQAPGQNELVDAILKVLNRVSAFPCGQDKAIAAIAAVEDVVAQTAAQSIIPIAAKQEVIPGTAK